MRPIIKACLRSLLPLLLCIPITFTFNCLLFGQDTNSALLLSKQRYERLIFTTPAYRNRVAALVMAEANLVAKALKLDEKLPITESSVDTFFISTPAIAKMNGSLGNISTTNYTYYVSIDSKFSFVEKRDLEGDYNQLLSEYKLPLSRMDTNAAYQLATQWLSAVSMDVASLKRDARCSIHARIPEGAKNYFVPVYRVSWTIEDEPVALVELFLPTKTLRDLRVERSEYILRKSVQITNLDFLLSQTNTLRHTNESLAPAKFK